jgi:hypothetical protein
MEPVTDRELLDLFLPTAVGWTVKDETVTLQVPDGREYLFIDLVVPNVKEFLDANRYRD